MNEKLMTVKDVADYLQYSVVQTRRLIKKNLIPSIRIGGSNRIIRVVPKELEKYIENQNKINEKG